MAVGTIIAANYVSTARVLCETFLRHNEGHEFYTLIIDGLDSDRALTGLGQVLLPEDIAWRGDEWFEMAAQYSVMELATAVKAGFMTHLLTLSDTATFFDPDIEVFGELSDIFHAARRFSIALTPHCLEPMPRDGLNINERSIMLAGIYNLGFISLGRGAFGFLDWWRERLRNDAIVDLANGLFTDQRWIDWVPALFRHTILRDPGLNVAYWNLHERGLHRGQGGQLMANDSPLKFFHYSGYNPALPSQLSKHAAPRPRVEFQDYPVVEDLCARYAASLAEHGHAEHRTTPYRLDELENGLHMTHRLRRLVRDELLRRTSGERIPNPYLDPEGFRRWLHLPVSGTYEHPVLRWQLALWESRNDLRAAFPDLEGVHAGAFSQWLRHDPEAAIERANIDGPTPRSDAATATATQRSHGGWTVVAYADAELGVGEAGRRLAKAMDLVGLPTEVVAAGGTLSRHQRRHNLPVSSVPSFANSITCVNADQIGRIWRKVGISERPTTDQGSGPSLIAGQRIGLWFWEVDVVPDEWLPALAQLDQLWVASEYTQRIFRPVAACPVEIVTLALTPPPPQTSFTRSMLGLPEDRFVFLGMFDYLSVLRRKNPIDLIEAYCAAFQPDDGAVLVLKSINGYQRPTERAQVVRAAARRPDILIQDAYRDSAEVDAMLRLSDCVVSLHRAEGYGLNLIDAMRHGVPVVATGYSGNLAFMDAQSAYLVPYDLVPVGPGSEPYPAHATWAQPDIARASLILRDIFDRPEQARTRGAAGRAKVLREHSLDVASARLRELLIGGNVAGGVAR